MSLPSLPSQEIIDQFVGNSHGNFPVVKNLLETYPSMIHAAASWNETAIQAATQTGQEEIVKYLLEHGAENGICTAAMLGNLDGVQQYLDQDNSLIDARGAHGIPLLYFPLIRGHQDIADYLHECGVNLNAASPEGITPLYGAVMFNQPQMVRWLLNHGADPNPRYEGKTPLTMALELNQPELIEILRSFGGRE